MRRIFLCLGLIAGMRTLFAATAVGGVFSVAPDKTVQFANANSIYSEKDLIQWANLEDVIEEGWDVLTGAEWMYLLTTGGRTNAADLNNLGKVNGKNGLIILPDAWAQPGGVPAFQPVDVEDGETYEKNTYTAAQWEIMAAAGAVFLPCRGYGYIDKGEYKEEDTDDHGSYWAKDATSATHANCMRFQEEGAGGIHDWNSAPKTNFYSVILVRTVSTTVLDEEDEADAYATAWASARTQSFAYVNRTLKKDGTLYTLCLPFDVPDIDVSPLAGAEVFTFEGGSVGGSVGNERLFLHLSRLSDKRLTQGVPYLLRWEATSPVQTLPAPLFFASVENWDSDTSPAAEPGNDDVKMRGVYPKAHIPGYNSGSVAHYNFFIGANNTLYWPDDALYPDSEMKGFRAYFYIVPVPDPASAPLRTMPVVWLIDTPLTSPTQTQKLVSDQPQASKILRNGHVWILYNGQVIPLL